METRGGKVGIVALTALAFVVVLTTSITIAGATTVKIDPATQDVVAGEAFSVDVVVENVTAMAACQGVVNFDQSAMQATAIIEGAFLQSAGPTIGVENLSVPGKAIFSYALTTPGSSVSGSGILATINFTSNITAAPGTYTLGLTDVMLLNTNTTSIRIDELLNGTVNTAPGPTPKPIEAVPGLSGGGLLATIGLLAIVLALSVITRRKRV